MRKAARDDEFVAYVAAQRPRLYRAAYLLCGSPHLAEDLVQATLTKLYVAWPRVSRADSVDAYVRRCLVNIHIDESRRPWRREEPAESLPDRVAAPPELALEDADALWAALRRLPQGQRTVIVLRHYWGLSVEETAQTLGIRPGTVKSQSSDALRSMRKALTPAEVPTKEANR